MPPTDRSMPVPSPTHLSEPEDADTSEPLTVRSMPLPSPDHLKDPEDGVTPIPLAQGISHEDSVHNGVTASLAVPISPSAISVDASLSTSRVSLSVTMDMEDDLIEEIEEVIFEHRSRALEEFKAKLRGETSVLYVDLLASNMLIAILILLNGILMGVEVDNDVGVTGLVLNVIFTVIWTLEVISKVYSYGPRGYFFNAWNQLDFLVAMSSIVDTSIAFSVGSESGIKSLSLARAARAIRVVRIIRSLRLFKELWLLVNGLIQACVALVWVFILIILVIYSYGIFMTYFVGQDCGEDGPFKDFEQCSNYYGTLGSSMITLFELMTMEMDSVRPIAKGNPLVFLVMLGFMMMTSFGLLNIIMGVIVDQVLQASADNEEKVQREKERRQKAELRTLRDIFGAADSDNNGQVTLEEFLHICKREDVQIVFSDLGMPVSRANLARRLFEVLDVSGLGWLGVDVFIQRVLSLKKEGKQINQDATLMLMDVRHLARRLRILETGMQEGFARVDGKLDCILQKVSSEGRLVV